MSTKQEFHLIATPEDFSEKVAQRLKACSDLFDIAYQIKSHRISQEHPELSAAEVKRLTMESIERGTR